ncbi:MAG: dihydrofolate reductase [Lachnospiraceae bacterium]|nr:dihydrofolate reductase [Lachnospiraceae bacterium]
MKLIAAVDQNWGIGNKGKLLVSIPEDMKFFRETTMGNVVVMGKNTLLSFPNGLPLKNRINIVLTTDRSFTAKDAVIVHDMEEALAEIRKYNTENVYVIGGASIYEQMLDCCDTAYITYIDYSYDADAYFPNLDQRQEWEMMDESEEKTYFDVEYYFRKYVKK